MWKDFFYFNKGEKRAIIILTLLIIMAQAALWTTDYWIPLLPEKITHYSANQEALKVFQDSITGENGENGEKTSYDSDGKSNRKYSGSNIPAKLTIFNPNTADSAKLVSLGLRPYVAKNILKYRRKGGTFRKAEDFARIYGVDPAMFDQLKPFIRIDSEIPETDKEASPYNMASSYNIKERGNTVESQNANKSILPSPVSSSIKSSGVLVMDVNKVDTAVMQQLKGVGAATANRIAQYRTRLGGFYSLRQLEEIKGIYPDALSRLQSFLKVDTTQIMKININKASLEKLKSHPYLNFYQAKVIVELRKARSGIKKISELADFKEFTKEDLERLRWYLAF